MYRAAKFGLKRLQSQIHTKSRTRTWGATCCILRNHFGATREHLPIASSLALKSVTESIEVLLSLSQLLLAEVFPLKTSDLTMPTTKSRRVYKSSNYSHPTDSP